MKILFISNYSGLYGANRSMLTIIEYLYKKSYDIMLILPSHGGICNELDKKGIPYKVFPMFTQLYYYKKNIKYIALPFLIISTLLKTPYLIKFVKKINPDLIYSNTSAEMIGIKIAKKLEIKHISHIREFMDLDHGANFLFGEKRKKKYINQSNGVIYVSKSVAKHVNMGEQLKDFQKVIYNGIQIHHNTFANKPIRNDLNLGVVGIFDPEKGQKLAIESMNNILKIYPKAKLHLWGDKEGAYKKEIIRLVKKLNLDKQIIFHGFVKDLDYIYKDMDVLLMCSRCEGFGRVTIEAMSYGIPVLGYDSGGTSELIKENINGYLFKSKEELVNKLCLLLKTEKHFNDIRKGAYDDAHKNYTIEEYCQSVEKFINFIMSK